MVRTRPFLVQPGRFLGDPIKSRIVCGVSMVDAVYHAGLVLPVHSHQSAYLCWIRSGLYSESYESRRRECLASTVVFHPAGERHAPRIGAADVFSFNVLRSLRLAEAQRLLATTTYPLCQVATSCGFADQSHLTRAFRQAYSVTPGRYRRLAR